MAVPPEPSVEVPAMDGPRCRGARDSEPLTGWFEYEVVLARTDPVGFALIGREDHAVAHQFPLTTPLNRVVLRSAGFRRAPRPMTTRRHEKSPVPVWRRLDHQMSRHLE